MCSVAEKCLRSVILHSTGCARGTNGRLCLVGVLSDYQFPMSCKFVERKVHICAQNFEDRTECTNRSGDGWRTVRQPL